MAAEYEVVDIWVGYFPGKAAVTEYLREQTDDDDEKSISKFAEDMGESFYDHDFLEHSFHDQLSSDIGARLEQHSFSLSFSAEACTAFRRDRVEPFNTILLVWGKQIETPASVNGAGYWLKHLRRFNCDLRV